MDKDEMAVALGRRGGRKGGPARAAALSPERRREIAQKAAAARWAKKQEKAAQQAAKGERWDDTPSVVRSVAIKLGDHVLDCHILDNGVRVAELQAIARIIGISAPAEMASELAALGNHTDAEQRFHIAGNWQLYRGLPLSILWELCRNRIEAAYGSKNAETIANAKQALEVLLGGLNHLDNSI